LKITHTFEKTIFYPNYRIVEILPDNKAKVEKPNSTIVRPGEETEKTIMDYSMEYQLPFKKNIENGILLMFKDRYRFERWDPETEVGHLIEVYDGKDTRILINTYRIDATNEIKKEGKIYRGQMKSIAYKFNPLMAWAPKDWPPDSYTMEKQKDEKLLFKSIKENKKYEALISPKNFMFLSSILEKGRAKKVFRVNQTVNAQDLIFPSDLEEMKYNGEGTPEYFFHFRDVKYEILKIDEFDKQCKLEFPAGTIMREDRGLSGIPE
jgi:hypothetical protein